MNGADYDADFVIVGSGVSGGLIAAALAKAGRSVIILEAGPRVTRPAIVETFRNAPVKLALTNMKLQSAGSPYPSMPWAPSTYGDYLQQTGPVRYNTSYLRVVGGTTWHFGSALWRMIPNEFRLNSLYGRGRDWPFGYDTLEPYYGRAELELGVSGEDQADQGGRGGRPFPVRSTPYPMKGLPNSYMFTRLSETLIKGGYNPVNEPNGRATRPYGVRPPCAGNNNCNPVCPIGAKYDGSMHIDAAERAGATLLANSVVYRIEDDEAGKVTAILFKTPDGTSKKVTGRHFVVAAHAIETPKLFLLSKTARSPNGIANDTDMVGRHLMDNTGISVMMRTKEDLWPGQGPTELLVYLNKRDGDFRRNSASYKIKVRNTVPTSQITSELLAEGIMGSRLDSEIRLRSARSLAWAVDFEMLPIPTNRVSLSRTKFDALGLPVPSLYYDVDDYWNAGRDMALEELKDYARLLDADITKTNLNHENRQHPSGTMIMGTDPANSVVDADCRTHTHRNLFVAGTSVMPAVSCMNPTLTAAALSIRLSDLLLQQA